MDKTKGRDASTKIRKGSTFFRLHSKLFSSKNNNNKWGLEMVVCMQTLPQTWEVKRFVSGRPSAHKLSSSKKLKITRTRNCKNI